MRKLELDTDLQYSMGDSFAFDENFKILRYSGYRETSISLWIDYGNLSSDYELEQDCMIEDSRENRVKIQRYLTKDGWKRVSDVYGNLEELCDDIGSVDYSNIEELNDLLDELGIAHTSNYLRTSTSGYSQGDYAKILINTKEFEKMAGVKFEENTYSKWFDHYFWDTPIYGEINVHFEYTKNAVNFEYNRCFEFNEWTDDEYDVDGLQIDAMITTICKEVIHPLSDDDVKEIKKALDGIMYSDVQYKRCG